MLFRSGPGVPAGGTAGQFYRKASATDYDGEWHTLSAGDSSYDSSLTYSSGTVGKELSDQKNTLNHLEDGLAIIVNGDTCSTAVPIGGYAYIKNNTHGLAEGLYTNTSASAFPTSGGTANSSVFTAVSGGGLNSLKNTFAPEVSTATAVTNVTHFGSRNSVLKSGNIVQFSAVLVIDADVASDGVIATLPYGARVSMYAITAIDRSYAIPLIIETDGKLKTTFALSSGKILRIAFTYITS